MADALTISFWLNPVSATDNQGVFDKGASGNSAYAVNIGALNQSPALFLNNYSNYLQIDSDITASTWRHITLTYDRLLGSQNMKIYGDGVVKGNNAYTTSVVANTQPLYIGKYYSDDFKYTGLLDEVRISNMERSADWISTEFANQNNPTSFFTLGGEETQVNTAPSVSAEMPSDGSTSEFVSLSQLSFVLTDSDGDPIDYNVTMTPDMIGGLQSGTGVASGSTINIPISSGPLAYNTPVSYTHLTLPTILLV